MEKLFFELLQVAIGNLQSLSAVPSKEEWLFLFQAAKKQSLVGIAFYGVQKLPIEQRPERSIILQWFAIASQIQERNARVTEVCQTLCHQFSNDNFNVCILKGQANHRYYGEELGLLRTCGDIDAWIAPRDSSCKHPVKMVLDYCFKRNLVESLCYLHVEYPQVKSVPVEIHLRPSFMNHPIRNRRFQEFFGHGSEKFAKYVCVQKIDKENALPVMQVDYDVIFQLNHIYRHLIDEGVGLRQVLDYYMLLKTLKKEGKVSKEELILQIGTLGMTRFAKALMFVLKEVFAIPSEYLICDVSEKDGRFLLDEILKSGNFGKYDTRLVRLNVQKGKTSYQIQRAWRRFVRNLNFFTSYPEEVIWEPFARIEHLWWRKFQLWRF